MVLMVKPRASTVEYSNQCSSAREYVFNLFHLVRIILRYLASVMPIDAVLCCTLVKMNSCTYTDVKNGSFGPPFRGRFTLAQVYPCWTSSLWLHAIDVRRHSFSICEDNGAIHRSATMNRRIRPLQPWGPSTPAMLPIQS